MVPTDDPIIALLRDAFPPTVFDASEALRQPARALLRYVERFPDRELARFAIDRHWHRYVSDDDQLAARQAVAEYEQREFPWLCEIETD